MYNFLRNGVCFARCKRQQTYNSFIVKLFYKITVVELLGKRLARASRSRVATSKQKPPVLATLAAKANP